MDTSTHEQMRAYLEQADRLGCLNTSPTGCTPPLRLLPLRYAVVGLDEDDPAQAGLPLLPAHLTLGLPLLQRARYVVRALRAGYLYLFHKQRGQWHVRPMQVGDNGRMWKYHPDAPPPAHWQEHLHHRLERQEPDEGGQPKNGPILEFGAPDQYEEVRLLYTPDPLTSAMQERYRTEAALRDTLQWVNVRQQANKYKPHADTLAPEQLEQTVLDYRLRAGRAVVPFPAPDVPRPAFAAEVEAKLHTQLYPLDERHLPSPADVHVGIVLRDPIGITQELNAWRNAATEQVKDWLDAKDKAGVTNERRVLVSRTFLELRDSFTQRRTAAIRKARHRYAEDYLDQAGQALPPGLSAEQWEQQRQAIERGRDAWDAADLQRRAATGEFAQRFEDRYAKSVNVPMMPVALQLFDTACARANANAAQRAPDHLTWLTSEALLTALDAYDVDDPGSGVNCAHQTGLCVLGLDGDAQGAQLLDTWWKAAKVERPNLALRGYTLNQRSLAAAFEQAVARLQGEVGGGLEAWQASLQNAKDLAAQYGAADGYLDTLSQYAPVHSAGALAWVGGLGRQVLRAGAPSTLDRALHRRLSVLLTAQLGPQALSLRLVEHAQTGHTPAPGRVAGPVLRTLDRAFVAGLNNAHNNAFYKLRLGSGLLLLEAGLLLLQGQTLEADAKWAAQVAAGAAATGAAGLEVLAIGTEQVLAGTQASSATYRGAQISLGRYRLWGAALAAAGVASLKLDWDEGFEAKDDKREYLAGAYFVRIGATVALLSSQGLTAFAQASAYLAWKAREAATAGTRGVRLLEGLAYLSDTLAANRAAMLLLGRAAFWAGAVVTVATVALMVLDDDALEEWCDRCCYRLRDDVKPYANLEEDLGALLGAVEEVV